MRMGEVYGCGEGLQLFETCHHSTFSVCFQLLTSGKKKKDPGPHLSLTHERKRYPFMIIIKAARLGLFGRHFKNGK